MLPAAEGLSVTAVSFGTRVSRARVNKVIPLVEAAAEYLCITKSHTVDILA